MPRTVEPWVSTLVRLTYPVGGPVASLCLAAEQSRPAITSLAAQLGVPPPERCILCQRRPRQMGHGGRLACEHCRFLTRNRAQKGWRGRGAEGPREEGKAPPIDEALLCRSRQLAEALRHGPIWRRALPRLSLTEAAIVALVDAAPHWYEGNLSFGLSLSEEGHRVLLGQPAPLSPEALALAECARLRTRISALCECLAVLDRA